VGESLPAASFALPAMSDSMPPQAAAATDALSTSPPIAARRVPSARSVPRWSPGGGGTRAGLDAPPLFGPNALTTVAGAAVVVWPLLGLATGVAFVRAAPELAEGSN